MSTRIHGILLSTAEPDSNFQSKDHRSRPSAIKVGFLFYMLATSGYDLSIGIIRHSFSKSPCVDITRPTPRPTVRIPCRRKTPSMILPSHPALRAEGVLGVARVFQAEAAHDTVTLAHEIVAAVRRGKQIRVLRIPRQSRNLRDTPPRDRTRRRTRA